MKRQDELNEAWCRYMNKCSTEIMQALAFALRWCDEHPAWISVEDELPPKTGFYNVVLNGDAYSLWYYQSINEWAEIYADEAGYLQSRKIEGITHWMPLPQPPKKGD